MPSGVTGPLYFREPQSLLEPGFSTDGHYHRFDHVTLFTAGRWLVECREGQRGNGRLLMKVELEGGTPGARLLIRADNWHRLTLLPGPKGCYVCIYPHRLENGDISVDYTGWEGAYDASC